jgi:Flp pilus assembly protein CpaB
VPVLGAFGAEGTIGKTVPNRISPKVRASLAVIATAQLSLSIRNQTSSHRSQTEFMHKGQNIHGNSLGVLSIYFWPAAGI